VPGYRDVVPSVGATPATLGPYTLLRQVGEGGMGVVHLALDPGSRPVAIKVLRPHVAVDTVGRQRLAREVKAMQRVRGKHVAEVLDADVEADLPYLVTRFVPGLGLDEQVAEFGPLGPRAQQLLALGLADALVSVHGAGVVHRDLKPGNVLLVGTVATVIDFGIAQLLDDVRLTTTGFLIGTPGYFAPEVARGVPATPASDIASWAATVAYAATGRPPYGRGPLDVVLGRVARGAYDLSGVPEPLAGLLEDALDLDPGRRPTAEQLRGACAALLESETTAAGHTRLLTAPGSTRIEPTRTEREPVRRDAAARHAPAHARHQPRTWDGQDQAPSPGAGGSTRVTGLPSRGSEDPHHGPGSPEHPDPADEQPVRREPAGAVLLAALLALLAGLLALAPLVGVAALFLVLVVVHVTDAAATMLDRRHAVRGRRRLVDPMLPVLALPVHLVSAALVTPLALLAGGLGALVGGAVGAAVAAATAASTELVGLCAAAGTVLAIAGGPGSRRLRRVPARAAGRLAPGSTTAIALLLAGAATVALLLALGQPATWWPLQPAEARELVPALLRDLVHASRA